MSARARFKEQDSYIRGQKPLTAGSSRKRNPLCRAVIRRFSGVRAMACEALGLRYVAVAAPRDLNQLRAAAAFAPDAIDRGIRSYIPWSYEIQGIGDVA